MRALLLISTVLIAGCTASERPSQQAALAEVPGKAIGNPVSCIQTRNVERVEAVNDYVAFFHMRGNKVYRTDFPQSCRGLKRDAFSHKTPTGNYCRGDIIQVFDPVSGFSTGGCSFGEFVPYELPKAEG